MKRAVLIYNQFNVKNQEPDEEQHQDRTFHH